MNKTVTGLSVLVAALSIICLALIIVVSTSNNDTSQVYHSKTILQSIIFSSRGMTRLRYFGLNWVLD